MPNSGAKRLTDEEIYAEPTITETITLHGLCWFGHVQRTAGNGIPKRVLYVNLERRRMRGRPRK
jgi:hypothetical protein